MRFYLIGQSFAEVMVKKKKKKKETVTLEGSTRTQMIT